MGKTEEQLKEDFARAKKAVRKKALRKKAVQKGEAAPSAIQQQLMEFQASTEEAFGNLDTEVADLGNAVNGLVQIAETQDGILHDHQEHLVEHDRKHKAADKKTKILETKTKILETLVSVFVIVLLAVVAAQVYDRADSLKSIFTPFFL